MKIIFANQKGGVGKTTLCLLLANYLAIEKKEDVIVLDMDNQRTIYDQWCKDEQEHDQQVYNTIINALSDFPEVEKEAREVKSDEMPLAHLDKVLNRHLKNNPELALFINNAKSYSWQERQLYTVISKDLSEYLDIKPALDKAKDSFIIMDLPGRMDDDDLLPVFQDADLVICPTSYDQFTIVSTFTFVGIMKHISPKVPIAFIPNKVKSSVRYELKSKISEKLRENGTVESDVPDRIGLQRLNTYSLPADIAVLTSSIFENIYTNYLKK